MTDYTSKARAFIKANAWEAFDNYERLTELLSQFGRACVDEDKEIIEMLEHDRDGMVDDRDRLQGMYDRLKLAYKDKTSKGDPTENAVRSFQDRIFALEHEVSKVEIKSFGFVNDILVLKKALDLIAHYVRPGFCEGPGCPGCIAAKALTALDPPKGGTDETG